jgi:hypothetical protein
LSRWFEIEVKKKEIQIAKERHRQEVARLQEYVWDLLAYLDAEKKYDRAELEYLVWSGSDLGTSD